MSTQRMSHQIVNGAHHFAFTHLTTDIKDWCDDHNRELTQEYMPAAMRNGRITLWARRPGYKLIINDAQLAMLFKLTFFNTDL